MTALLRRASLWGLPIIVLGGALFLYASGWMYPSLQQALLSLLEFVHPIPQSVLHLPAHMREANLAFVAVAGAGIITLLARERLAASIAVFVVALGATAGLCWQLYRAETLLFDPSFIAIALTAVFAAALTAYAADGAGVRGRLNYLLGAHLSPAAIAVIAREPERLNLAGETRTMTYLVCNMRGYSELADSFATDPAGFARLTRRVLTPLAQAVLDRRGTIDRVSPGGLTAFFNAPLEDPEHAIHACEAALRMTEALDGINRALENERRPDGTPGKAVEIGIGINSGAGVVADFGTPARPEYSAASRAMAFAQFIEALSAKYGPAIIVGDATRKLAERNFAFLEVDMAESPGSGERAALFALLGNPLVRASPKFRALQTFHDHIFAAYRGRDWEKAKTLIEQCRQLSGASPQLYELYLKRIAFFERNPPPEGWNGIVRPEII
jgi:adenylate cyclase